MFILLLYHFRRRVFHPLDHGTLSSFVNLTPQKLKAIWSLTDSNPHEFENGARTVLCLAPPSSPGRLCTDKLVTINQAQHHNSALLVVVQCALGAFCAVAMLVSCLSHLQLLGFSGFSERL